MSKTKEIKKRDLFIWKTGPFSREKASDSAVQLSEKSFSIHP